MADGYPENPAEFFELLRKRLNSHGPEGEADFHRMFDELIRRFEEALQAVASRGSAAEEEFERASEYLREIVFMDGCLGAEQRRELGARLLANYILSSRQLKGRKKVRDIFHTAPVADYFLAYALAWQLGWFDKTQRNQGSRKSASTEESPTLKILSLHSVKGGTGKTFLAHSYALACARDRGEERGRKTVIVDLDFTGPTLQFLGPALASPPSLMDAFPIFFNDQLPIFESGARSIGESLKKSGDDATILAQNLCDLFSNHERGSFLPFEVKERRPPNDDSEESEQTFQEWKRSLDICLRESELLARCRQEGLRQEKIFDLVLPHRPEFLRRAGRLLESPDWKGWRLLRAWLMWLLDELRNRGFEVVILDNAPGISTTYTIMNLVWGLNGSVSVGDRAVCVVSSPRISDIVNTAYELLWLQAADWTQSRDTEEKRRVYWTGNMWAGLSLEEMIEKNTLPFLFTSESEISADPLPIHGCARMAHRFAGLTDDDLKRIEAVLRAAVERKRVIPSSVQYREDIRKLFDFDVTDKGLQGLNKIVSELATREPLRTLLQQKSEGKS